MAAPGDRPSPRQPAKPAMLTVEEAAAQLRIGRTKAYKMARQWRDTAGRSGLPVRDMGGLLRVPVAELEEVFGIQLLPLPPTAATTQPRATPAEPAEPDGTRHAGRTSRRPRRSSGQLGLFTAEG